jgi:hypothetical protein
MKSTKTITNVLYLALFISLGMFLHTIWMGLEVYTIETIMYVQMLLLLNVIALAYSLYTQD